ncbi:anthranilate phosphoribosyltransferase [Neomegalonema sp.]|uniref:anthranilate phosphoribosyltransferase n=1 Tax=Neomegalonema sp. TaxID=2039713 RepID=UPI0026196741|nr:anthranilate phosphoribosyltransferase [Neomegalonema sp.]MDD2869715.1 anthranilate phosphoribosyltransferase [Neomegalonema sp.]
MSAETPSPESVAEFRALIAKAVEGELPHADALRAFGILMSGGATPSQVGAFLMALRMRSESFDEIAAAAQSMRERMLRVQAPEGAIDIVGTGGDGRKTLNISTAAAFIAAGAGVPVAKHGNRAVSSLSGAADALSLLGIDLNASPATIERALREARIGFMMAPNHHSAMRHVMPARREIGVRTIFNILGPLTNPAGVKRQLSGSFSPHLLLAMAETLRSFGSERAWLVHGGDGTDEISISADTEVVALEEDGEIRRFTVSPAEAGLESHSFLSIRGGSPAENAAALEAVLKGARNPYRDAALLNAAAGLLVAGKAQDLREGAALGAKSLDSGAAFAALEALRRIAPAPVPAA